MSSLARRGRRPAARRRSARPCGRVRRRRASLEARHDVERDAHEDALEHAVPPARAGRGGRAAKVPRAAATRRGSFVRSASDDQLDPAAPPAGGSRPATAFRPRSTPRRSASSPWRYRSPSCAADPPAAARRAARRRAPRGPASSTVPGATPSGSAAGSIGARPTARPAAGNSTTMRCGSAVTSRRRRSMVHWFVMVPSRRRGWPACSASATPRGVVGVPRQLDGRHTAVADLARASPVRRRGRADPDRARGARARSGIMSSTCTFTSRSPAARRAPTTPSGSTTTQCPRSTVMPSASGEPSSSRRRSASATVSTSMPGSGSKPSTTPDASAYATISRIRGRRAERQASSGATPSGSDPRPERDAVRVEDRRELDRAAQEPHARLRVLVDERRAVLARTGRAGTGCRSRRRRASPAASSRRAGARPARGSPRRTGRGADARA